MTTVSRYMKHLMRGLGVDPLVIPNGLGAEALVLPKREAMAAFQTRVRGRTVLSKVARWDPGKQWLLAIDTVKALKRQGWRPLLIARGGLEAHGAEVLEAAAAAGLRVVEPATLQGGLRGLLQSVEEGSEADIVNLPACHWIQRVVGSCCVARRRSWRIAPMSRLVWSGWRRWR
jgi:hypothetical protein